MGEGMCRYADMQNYGGVIMPQIEPAQHGGTECHFRWHGCLAGFDGLWEKADI